MTLSVKQLREFVAVADAGNITRAAEALFVAQPALSLAIRRLETQLGRHPVRAPARAASG